MSKYYVNKFLFRSTATPSCSRRYKEDPAGLVARWEDSTSRPRGSTTPSGPPWLSFTDAERRGPRRARLRRALRDGRPLLPVPDDHIAIYDEDYMTPAARSPSSASTPPSSRTGSARTTRPSRSSRPGHRIDEGVAMTTAPTTAVSGLPASTGLPADGQPVVLRHGTVVTVDDARRVLPDADVLVVGTDIAAIGPDLTVPDGTFEIDASGGIVMPGMIDTHRHMWQTAMRGYGADWTLTQYFVWYYLEHGKRFRPQDIARRQPAVGARRHRRRGHDDGRLVARPAAPSSTRRRRSTRSTSSPGRFVLALRQHLRRPVGVVGRPASSASCETATRGSRPASACSWPSTSPATPPSPSARRSRWPASWACPSPRTPGSGARRTTTASGSCTRTGSCSPTPSTSTPRRFSHDSYHRIAATGGSVSLVDRERAELRAGLPAVMGAARARHPGVALGRHQRVVLRRPVRGDARDPRGGPVAGSTSRRTRSATPSPTRTCGPSTWSTGRPAAAQRRSGWTSSSVSSRSASAPTSC